MDTWITFDRRNWQDTSFAPNFGLACIWNFVAMFIISSYRYFYIFVYLRFIFFELYICIDIYIYTIFIIDLYPYLYRQHKHARAHTHYGSQSYCFFLCCRDVSDLIEGSCRHGKNGRQRELVSPTLGSYRNKPRELVR